MSDYETLNTLGTWIAQNQDKRGTDDWNTVAAAFQKLDSQLQGAAQKEVEYQGLSGKVRAGAEQLLPGAAGGLGGLIDLTNMVNPLYPLARFGYHAVTGKDIGARSHLAGDLGQKTREATGAPDIRELPASARGSGYAGEALGQMLGVSALGGGALGAVGRFAPEMLGDGALSAAARYVAANPGKVAGGELASALGAGGGTYAADIVAPDNDLAHAIGGLAGSVVGPTAVLARAGQAAGKVPGAKTLGAKVRTALNPEEALAGNLGAAYETYGAQLGFAPEARIAQTINDLKSAEGFGPATTRTVDPVIHDLAAHLGQKDALVGRSIREAEDRAIGQLGSDAVAQLGGQGSSPEDFVKLFQQRADAAKANVEGVQGRVQQRARGAADKLRVSDTEEALAGSNVNDALTASLMARKRDLDVLEGRIPDATVLNPTAARVFRSHMAQATRATPSAELSADTNVLLNRIAANPQATLGEYRELYSQLRADARMFRADPTKQRAAALAEQMADNVDTMIAYRANRNPGLRNVPPYNQAARKLYDDFQRAAPGQVRGYTRAGGKKTPPPLSAQKVLQGTGLAQGQKIDEMFNVLPQPFARTALETEQRAQAGRAILDPQTGLANPASAARNLQNEAGIYERFPGLRGDIEDAASTASLSKTVDRQADAFRKMLSDEKTTFGRVLANSETPEAAVATVLSGKNPVSDLEAMHRVVQKFGPQGKEAMSAVLSRYVASGETELARALNLTEKVNSKGVTLADWMRSRGYLSSSEHAQAVKRANQIIETEAARKLALPNAVDPQSKTPDTARLLARIAGASAGSKLSALFGKRTLIGAAEGSKRGEQLLHLAGGPNQMKMLESGIHSPQGLAALLERYQAQRAASAPAPKFTPDGKRIAPLPFSGATYGGLVKTGAALTDKRDERKRPRGLLN